MRERPIIFSDPMVRAILDGRKTQTRRIVKPIGNDDRFVMLDYGSGWWPYRSNYGESHMKGDKEIPHACPYGQPGDRLWVREAWAYNPYDDRVWYRATDELPSKDEYGPLRWLASIHMARADSRITLEITGVRVEPLQNITEADAIAEGVTPKWEPGCSGRLMEALNGFSFRPAASAYLDLWEQINGPGSASANPWVWVIQFEKVKERQP